jgi:hypothetical protein
MGVVLAAFTFVSIFCVNLFAPRPAGEFAQSPNELSRYELVVSIVDRGSFSIGPELARFGNHEDKAVYSGRFYSNKAPGLSLAAVPAYAAVRLFTGPARPGNAATVFYLLRLSTVTAASIAALFVFGRRLARTAADPRWAPIVLFAVAFGTPFLVYARSFFSHAWTASLLYLAFECLHRDEEKAWHAPVAGFLAGWAVLSEYPAAIVAVVLLLDAVWRRPLRRGFAFALGALPPAAVLGLYDAACFAGPFDLSSAHEWYQPFSKLSRHKFFGFALPSPRIAFDLLLSPSRGVLVQSPFFLFLSLALAGGGPRDRARRVSLAAAGLLFVAMCAYENWHGGWSLGPRYLLPVLLLAAWPLAEVSRRASRAATILFAAAVVAAAAFFLFSSSTFWFYPAEPWNAPRFFSAFWLSRGWFVPTLVGGSAGGVAVLAIATAIAAAAALRAFLPRRDDLLLGMLAGAAGFALLFAGPAPHGAFEDRLTRARILESFTDLDSDRGELVRLGAEAATASDRAAWERAVAHYAGRR